MSLSKEHCQNDALKLEMTEAADMTGGLQGWRLVDSTLQKSWDFKNFYQTMAFVNAVAFIADTQDHHPDMNVSYNHCTLIWSTHSAGGLTRNDFICAARVDALFE